LLFDRSPVNEVIRSTVAHLLKVAQRLPDHLVGQVEFPCHVILLHPLLLSEGRQQDDTQPSGVLLQQSKQQQFKTAAAR
jgi:hypothetical protein